MSLFHKIQGLFSSASTNRMIVPFTSIGNLLFTDSREQIRRKLNEKFDAGVYEFDGLKELYDYFEDSEIKILYNEQQCVNAFEFFKSPLMFDGVDLLTLQFSELLKIFSALDPDLMSDQSEFTSNKFGIGGRAAYDDDGNSTTAESVIVFRKGYYDRLDEFMK